MSFTLLFVLLVPPVLAAVNLLKNPDFEKNTFSQSNGEWYASGCTTVLSRDSFTGAHSVYVSHRTGTLTGMYQNVKLTAGRNYYFKAHIKLLNVPAGQLTENVKVIASTHTEQSQSHFMISMNKLMQPNIWQVVGGDFSTPHAKSPSEYISKHRTPRSRLNYLLDASSLVLIPQLPPNWKSTASATIDRIRKADINIRVQGHHSLNDLQDVTAEIVQNRHEFGFGSAVKASYMTDSTHSAYQKAFYDNFEWATIENKLKWRLIERSKGHIDYDTGLNAINALLAKGIKIRAHNLFWDRSDRSPAWLHGKTGNALLQEMKTRINGIVTKTKGKVESWDVNNENLHNNYFEIGTGNVNITMWMFQEAHKVDPNVKLFLNDFNIISRGFSTQDYYNQATLFKARRDVHLYGIGIQSHMKPPFDISVIKYRLEQVAAAGLPIWISELDLPVHDVNERANDLEDLFTLFFSTPQIEGIMLWGFWDGAQTDPNKALFNGNSVQPNAAGLRYQKLVKKDWKTNESASLASGHAHVRGFKGEYTLRVKRQGHLLKEEHFTLSGSGVNLRVSVSGTGSGNGKFAPRVDPICELWFRNLWWAGQISPAKIQNPDFEKNTFSQSSNEWYASGCTAVFSDDSFTGAHSVHVSHRKAESAGMDQVVKLTPGRNYYFKAHIKLLNIPSGHLTDEVKVMAEFRTAHSHSYSLISKNEVMQPQIWQAIGGDFTAPSGVVSARIYIHPQDQTVDYLLDSSSLVLIPHLPSNWKSVANATIDRIRKADINIRVHGHHSLHDLHGVTAEIVQNRHEFGFGSAVKASYMTDSTHTAYRNAFYNNFEWATLENKLKWYIMEPRKGHIDYDTALNAINVMRTKGIKIRAHNLFWDRARSVPSWVHGTKGNALLQEMKTRIHGVVSKTKGKVEQWDVNNENLHGDYFEVGTGNANITMWMFQETHKVDPKVKLFLNDYQVINYRYTTQDFYDQAMMFKARHDVPLYGLGIQSHMKPPIDISVVKYRLDQILATGLPIWITEFDLLVHDVNERANNLEDLFTLFFSTPQIEGIVLWGFWDGAITDPNKALFNGHSVKPNAAGLRYQQLVKKYWKTNESASLASGHAHVRGFKGDYTLRVKRQGHLLKEEHFTLSGTGADLSVTVSGTGGNVHVSHVVIG